MRLTDYKVLTFDCYGTLIDWETGMVGALQPLTSRAPRELTREEILATHARHESAQQRQTPTRLYRDLLAVVYKRMAEEWSVSASWDECVAYGHSVRDWPVFEDSAAALAYLKNHYRLVILSNVDNENFSHSNRKLAVEFDAVMTAEDIGSYKPSRSNFEYLLAKLGERGLRKADVLHVAESLFHDHAPANGLGIASCWIHRRHEQEGFGATLQPGEMPKVDFKFRSMAQLADAHRREQRAG